MNNMTPTDFVIKYLPNCQAKLHKWITDRDLSYYYSAQEPKPCPPPFVDEYFEEALKCYTAKRLMEQRQACQRIFDNVYEKYNQDSEELLLQFKQIFWNNKLMFAPSELKSNKCKTDKK